MGMTSAMRALSKHLRENKGITADHRHMEEGYQSYEGYGEGIEVNVESADYANTFIVMTSEDYNTLVDEKIEHYLQDNVYSNIDSSFHNAIDNDMCVEVVKSEFMQDVEDLPEDYSYIQCGDEEYVIIED